MSAAASFGALKVKFKHKGDGIRVLTSNDEQILNLEVANHIYNRLNGVCFSLT